MLYKVGAFPIDMAEALEENSGPFDGLTQNSENFTQYNAILLGLINDHPLTIEQIVEVCFRSWNSLMSSSISEADLRFDRDIFVDGRVIGNLLHFLVPYHLSQVSEGWRQEQAKIDKDVVYIPDVRYSFEMKGTTQGGNAVYGNRSYAQESIDPDKPDISGYFLALNYTKMNEDNPGNSTIARIRFGWLDKSDWTGQAQPTGQQAVPTLFARKHKLAELWPNPVEYLHVNESSLDRLKQSVSQILGQEEE